MSAHVAIPVADAPLLAREAARRSATHVGATHVGAAREAARISPLYSVLLVWTLVHVTRFLYIRGTEPWTPVLTFARYFLWPAIIVALCIHVSQRGLGDLRRNFAFLLPFLFIGIISSFLGIWPIESLRHVVFWLFCILCAATLGAQMTLRATRSTLLWTFFAMMVASAAVAVLAPELGREPGDRGVLGAAWRGLFTSKNQLGLTCVYAVLFAGFARGNSRIVRVVAMIAGAVALVLSNSQGAMVAGIAACAYLALIFVLRRSKLSVGIQATLLALTTLTATAGLYFLSGPLLELMGRDATLTGRTVIWQAFFQRALLFWPIGGGPGSFTSLASPYVLDLAYRFRELGIINTPHNMYISALGEVGIFGTIAFVLPIFYFAFVLPFRNASIAALEAATIAFTMVIGGMSEAREVFGISLNMFLLILMVAGVNRDAREARDAPDQAIPDARSGSAEPGSASPAAETERLGPRVLGA